MLMRSWGRYSPIVVLFVALRLMFMAVFPPDNLTLFSDYVYYELARYSDQGYLPFIYYWSEYPPVFPFLSVGVYRSAHLFGGGYHAYVYLMGLLMLMVNTANLVLFLRLAQRMRGEESVERLGWIYSVLFRPLIYTWWNFDALHFDPAIATTPVRNPARIPAWVTLCDFGLVYGLILSRRVCAKALAAWCPLSVPPSVFSVAQGLESAVAGAAFPFVTLGVAVAAQCVVYPGVELCQPGRVAGVAFAGNESMALPDDAAVHVLLVLMLVEMIRQSWRPKREN